MIIANPDRTNTLIDALTTLWETSVHATHYFLSEDDIQKLIPFVRMGLSGIETLVVVYEEQKYTAFIGIEADKIEMLFVSPAYFGKGIGKELTTLAIIQYGVGYVDVNEQNTQAFGFYRHIGFEEFERTELDEQGNPFPILKMKLRLFSIRRATSDDIAAIKDLFQGTVLTINRCHYSQAEVEDWASCGNDVSRWRKLIETLYFIVAENSQSKIVGFSSISQEGYLHSMFIHKDFQGRGVATLLLDAVERYARENKITKITSEVSLTARRFFEKRGYVVKTEQKRQANKLCLTNFEMIKN